MNRLFHTNKLKTLKVKTLIFILVSIIVLFTSIISNVFISRHVENRTKDSLGDKIRSVARMVAHSDIVMDGMQNKQINKKIPSYANEVMELTDVGFVVVLDMNLIRHSHPLEEEIGKSFYNREDASTSLEGREYFSVEEGPLGMGMRVFTPIYNDSQNQIGVVCVGVSLDSVEEEIQESHQFIMIGTIFQLIIGFIGAYFLSTYIKNTLFGLEPIEIAQLVEENRTMLESVKEGIVVVNESGEISLVNNAALRLMQIKNNRDILDEPAENYMPVFNKVIVSGKPEVDFEQELYGNSVLINCVPIFVNEEIVGAIATFRDKTEVKLLSEELSGIRNYTETIRAQSHEFKNKLHVILGMLHMKKYDELQQFIPSIIDDYQRESGYLVKRIKDSAFAGFILGKMSKARELGISFTIHENSHLPNEFDQSTIHDLITITGSLIENAFDAVNDQEDKKVSLFMIETDSKLFLKISDNGEGIPDHLKDKIFQKKFTTKGENRGYGLYLMKQAIDKLGGELEIASKSNKGSIFKVTIRLSRGKDPKND